VLLEFQSRPDRYMPVRLMTYTGLFYEQLIAEGRLAPSGRLPQVIPVVLYNGLAAWGTPLDLAELIERFDSSAEAYVPHLRYKLVHEAAYGEEELAKKESPVADLFHLERSANWQDVRIGVERLEEHVKFDEEPELYRAFVGWLRELIFPRLGLTPDEIPQGLTLKEFEPMLAERIDSWNEKVRQEGWQEGQQHGLQQGEAKTLLLFLETRFGPVDQATRDRIAAADAQRLMKWVKRSATAASLADVFG
jgi:putative YhgA-like transposase